MGFVLLLLSILALVLIGAVYVILFSNSGSDMSERFFSFSCYWILYTTALPLTGKIY